MEVNGVPNVRTESTLLKNEMQVKAQNVIGSTEFDLMGFMDKLSVFMPAGWRKEILVYFFIKFDLAAIPKRIIAYHVVIFVYCRIGARSAFAHSEADGNGAFKYR